MEYRHLQEAMLLKFVDGQLSGNELARIEALIKVDPIAADIVQQLEQSKLPFREAFEPLLENIVMGDELNNLCLEKSSRERKWLPKLATLAATLLFGVFLGSALLSVLKENHDDWMVQVADYQLLYVRNTVRHTQLNSDEITQLNERLNLALGAEIIIPDLSAQELTFKRGQILSVNGQPLIQLVYLPRQGDPVALCITRNLKPATEIQTRHVRGMTLAHWSNSDQEFVMVGKLDSAQLNPDIS